MSINEKKIVDFKVVTKANDSSAFSSGLYSWLMFLINLYSRVKKNLKIDFDSFIILQLVVSNYLYKTNKEGIKDYKETGELFNSDKNLFKENRKVNIVSVAEILNLPRETVRRKVMYLSKLKLLDYNKKGVGLGSEYKNVFNEFVYETTNNISSLIKKWNSDGSLNQLLNMKKK